MSDLRKVGNTNLYRIKDMIKTYRFIASTTNGVSFADITAPSNTLNFANERKTVTRGGVTAPVVRTSVVMTKPVSLSAPECTDKCAPHGQFTRSLRLETSHPSDSAALIADLTELVNFLELNPSVFNGFNPPASVDILLGTE